MKSLINNARTLLLAVVVSCAVPIAHAQTAMRLDYNFGQTAPAQASKPASPGAPATPGASTAPAPTPATGGQAPAPGTQSSPLAVLPVTGQVEVRGPVQSLDYTANLQSEVFGANLFTGAFAGRGGAQFNPDYAIAVGDQIQVRFWGAFQYESVLTVDPKGNIFLPHVGPVRVMGVRNQELQRAVEGAVGKVFRSNVFSYASLAAAQPVRLFVSGFVRRPGMYGGTSMDSLLNYLDQAGGIDPDRGSFLNIQVKRGTQIRATVSLYDFLLDGRMPLIQLADGDVIFVSSLQNTFRVSGLVENPKRFEFAEPSRSVADIVRMAKPRAHATHVRVVRNSRATRNTDYYSLSQVAGISLQNGDEIEFTSDKMQGTISVRVEGEHQSPQEYVLPYGSRLADLMKSVQFNERSDADSVQLFRISVKERQRALLHTSLRSLESAALTARSGTNTEAQLRKEEAELLLRWVERAKTIEPSGQVLIAQHGGAEQLLLENGDVLRIPIKDGLVLIGGEVLFPNTVAFNDGLSVSDYIKRAGGYTQNADASRVVVAHRDGSFDEMQTGWFSFGSSPTVRAGDQILVLPKIDVKNREIFKDLAQIIFHLAVARTQILSPR